MKRIYYFLLAIGLLFAVNANAASVLHSLFHAGNDPIGGNPNGKVTIVEFFDYQCGHCMNMAYTLQNIIRQNPDVRVVFKEFPIRGATSEVQSRAALAANMQGKYLAFNHALLTSDRYMNENIILEIAKSKGLNVNKMRKDMNSPAVRAKIAANRALGNQLGIAGTPAFFIGKTNATNTKDVNYVLGEMSQSALQNAIDKTRL